MLHLNGPEIDEALQTRGACGGSLTIVGSATNGFDSRCTGGGFTSRSTGGGGLTSRRTGGGGALTSMRVDDAADAAGLASRSTGGAGLASRCSGGGGLASRDIGGGAGDGVSRGADAKRSSSRNGLLSVGGGTDTAATAAGSSTSPSNGFMTTALDGLDFDAGTAEARAFGINEYAVSGSSTDELN